jgi:hypothetical protein
MKTRNQMLSILGSVLILSGALSCGTVTDTIVSGGSSKKNNTSGAQPDSAAGGENKGSPNKDIQLKGAFLLAQSIGATFGQGKDLVEKPRQNRNDPVSRESCFSQYGSNFGSEDGLRFGELYADSPSSSYFMALSICAVKVSAACLAESTDPNSSCFCGTRESAIAMMRRAMPYLDISKPELQPVVDEFEKSCKANYPKAVAALINNLGFVSRR